MPQERNQAMIDNLSADLQDKSDPAFAWSRAISLLALLPGCRGVWPMSVFDSNGDAIDVSGHGHHLSYVGDPLYNYAEFAPYLDLDGAGDFLSRGDEADLDILGDETYVASAIQGLTCGGWFNPDTVAGIQGLITKGDAATAAGSSWNLNINSGLQAVIYNSTSSFEPATRPTVVVDTWQYCCLRFLASNNIATFLNDTKEENTTSIPSTINNTTRPFNIGRVNSTTFDFNGQASLCFLCTTALSDEAISRIFRYTRHLFHV